MDEFSLINYLIKEVSFYDLLSNDGFVVNNLQKTVFTKDVIVDGVHSLSGTSGYLMGKKALRVNLSDIASMGANPTYYLLGLVVNRNNSDNWFYDLCLGLKEDSKTFGLSLIGGDTVFHDGANIISITMCGSLANNNQELKRSGAKIGDLVCTTGTIGDSAFGLMICQGKLNFDSDFLKCRYQLPDPKIKIGSILLNYASSCIDISDGLIQDAEHICTSSGVGMNISINKIPLSKDVKNIISIHPNFIQQIFSGGDDYELLFTISEQNYINLQKDYITDCTSITIVGNVICGNKVNIIDDNGNEKYFNKKGFIHK